MSKYDLTRYTKEELIWLVEYAAAGCYRDRIGSGLIEIEHKRAMDRINRADAHARKAAAAREQYIQIMKPYAGMRLSDIDLDVLEKARAALAKAEREDQAYKRIISK